MIVRELITKLGFNVDHKAIDRAEKGMKSLRNVALAVSGAFVAVGAGLLKITNQVAETGDYFEKASKRIGMNGEELQKLAYSARLAGLSNENLEMGMGRLARVMIEARDGSKTAADAFGKLKLDPKNIKSMDEVILALADKFKDMADGAEKSALAQELLGRGGRAMIPILNMGSAAIKEQGLELVKLHAVMSGKLLKDSEEYNDNWKRIKLAITGFKNVIAEKLLPILIKYQQKFLDWITDEKNFERIQKNVNHAVEKFVEIAEKAAKAMERFFEIMGGRDEQGDIDYVNGLANAFKVLAAIIGIIVTGKIAMALQGIIGLAKPLMMALLGVKGVFVLIAAAIIAAIALIVLYIQDFWTFLKGGKSVYAEVQRQFYRLFYNIYYWAKSKLDALVEFLKQLWDDPLGVARQVWDGLLSWLDEKIQNLINTIMGIPEALSRAWEWIKSAGGAISDFFKPSIAQLDAIKAEERIKAQQKYFPDAPSSLAGITGGNNNEYNIESKVEVKVETGADPEKIAKTVGEETKKSWNKIVRPALRATKKGGY